MKKLLCVLSALAVFIVSGCSGAPSEAPLFDKFTADCTEYPVKITWEEDAATYDADASSVISTYYIAAPDKWYCSLAVDGESADMLYENGVVYSLMHEEKTVFAATADEETSALVGYIPAEPQKWALTEKGEAQYEGKTYIYETASLDDKYVLTLFADPETKDIVYACKGSGGSMAKLAEITNSFDLRIFDIPEDYEIVNIPSVG